MGKAPVGGSARGSAEKRVKPRTRVALGGRFQAGKLTHNLLLLYALHVANYALPLVTIPYLARVLGPSAWGALSVAQALGLYTTILMTYGFELSATREVARRRGETERLAHVLAGVLGARSVLGLISLGGALVAERTIPALGDQPALLWSALFWGLAQGSNLTWFFLGLEQVYVTAGLEAAGRIVATIAIFVLVRAPTDAWLAPALQGATASVVVLASVALAGRRVPLRRPTWSATWSALRLGWSMFVFRGAVSLYTVGNALVLALFAPPQVVGYYAGAERIGKGFVSLLQPLTQALYPRLSYLAHHSIVEAARVGRVAARVTLGVGLLTGVVLFVLAPMLVDLLLGPSFGPAVPVLRLMAALPPLIAVSNVFGFQWLLPRGLDAPFNATILLAGLFNLTLVVLLAPAFGSMGAAAAAVAAEMFVAAGLYVVLVKRGLHPLAARSAAS